MLMKDEEIAKIKHKSEYDDNTDDWVVPPFMLKAKEVTLPSLKKNGYDVMDQEKENRELAIDGGEESGGSQESDGGTGFKKGGLFDGKNVRSSQ